MRRRHEGLRGRSNSVSYKGVVFHLKLRSYGNKRDQGDRRDSQVELGPLKISQSRTTLQCKKRQRKLGEHPETTQSYFLREEMQETRR